MEPHWIDRAEYPFTSRFLDLTADRIRYVDEGSGSAVVMVHGTPEWSFIYRRLIKGLSPRYRCIAPDHLGFGLSDKPADWSYRPEDHAKNLRLLIETLGLKDITLIVQDYGGPIGLSYALEHPENVRSLILLNTWMWSVAGDKTVVSASRFFGTAFGRFLYKRLGFSARVIMPMAMGDRKKLTRAVHRQYLYPLATPQERHGTWVLARELLGSSSWYDSLWGKRDAIKDKPTLLLWGMKDPTFMAAPALERWQQLFTRADAITFPSAGHFVQEEEGDNLVPLIRKFLETENR